MSIRSINIGHNNLMIKKNKTRKTKKIPDDIKFNTTNIRKLLLEKLKLHKKSKKNISINDNTLENNEPQYGNLKNGNKPTFKELNSSYKNYEVNLNNQPMNPVVSQPMNPVVSQPMQQMINQPMNPVVSQPMQQPIQQVISRDSLVISDKKNDIIQSKKIILGKTDNKNISILIKGNKSRKKNEKMKINLKEKKLFTIKKYLNDKNLVKHGTCAPSNLLKEIYESSHIIGDIYNTNGDILLSNYNDLNNKSI